MKSRMQLLIVEGTFENFQKITEEDWDTRVFKKIETLPGKLWDAPIEIDLILPCNEEFQTGNRTVKRAIGNLGGTKGLRNQKKKPRELTMKIQTLGFPDKDGNVTNISKNIYLSIYQNIYNE